MFEIFNVQPTWEMVALISRIEIFYVLWPSIRERESSILDKYFVFKQSSQEEGVKRSSSKPVAMIKSRSKYSEFCISGTFCSTFYTSLVLSMAMSPLIFFSIVFAYNWVVLMLVCPNIFETVSIGTLFDRVMVVAKVCLAM